MTFDQQRKMRDCIDRLRMALQTYENERIKECTKSLKDAMYAISTEAYLSTGGSRAEQAAKQAGVDVEAARASAAGGGGGMGGDGGGMSGGDDGGDAATPSTEPEPEDEDLFDWFNKDE